MSPRQALTCADCGRSDQMQYGPTSHGRHFLGCVRCQNAKEYDSFAAMWAAWCALAERKPPAEPVQPALFEVTP